MITGNRGEWSEIYALFKLLGDKQLFLGNKDIEKLEGFVYPIIKILRSENDGDFEYSVQDEIILVSGKEKMLKIPITEFKEKAIFLLKAIKDNKDRTFAVPEIEEFMYSIKCMSLKASSSAKTDITIVIHDQRTNQQPTLGFSIKSQLGGSSTLLNAGKTTNFVFKIVGILSGENIEIINSMVVKRGKKEHADLKGRVRAIAQNNCYLSFSKVDRQVFSNNLILIDSRLPEYLSNIIISFFTTETSKLADLVAEIAKQNPLNYDIENDHKFYEYKIKRFLTDVALGMMPANVWSGKYDATGGYLIVKDSGEILCYHIYDRNEFEDYLLNNTKLETASSSRHGFGKIYEENESLYLKLNLQIRFIK